MRKVSLTQMKERQKGTILDISGGLGLQNKFMSMGIYKGREITKISHIGLKGPVAIKVGRSVLVLGHGVANKIVIESHD
ncbi:MAG: FeoA family protein [Candidatus Omnitrophica bacterium]|nr:FeoA family protein [Candidatus Omnitrophota bacterium]MDD5691218.1 FeoA family protein [Candidatus Omnitrophota bacterium]